MRNKDEIRLQRVVAFFCATIFSIFTFFFVAKYQAPLLELLYDKVATGKLQYNAYAVGAIATIVLMFLAIWLNRYSGFRREWTALSYLPSMLLLAFSTDIDRSLYVGEYDYTKWLIVFAVGAFTYASFSFVLHRILFAKIKNVAMSANRIIWKNLVLFVIMFCMVGALSNGEENFKREALVASYCKKRDWDKALEVGYMSDAVSPSLAAQRAYVLARNGLLGEKLFEYPQPYGSKGLLPGITQVSPLVPDSVFMLIGAVPTEGESNTLFLERVAKETESTDAAKEYYLSAHLLDRNIVGFAESVRHFYPDMDILTLPKHYREALLLYSSISGDESFASGDWEMRELFDAFKTVEAEYEDPFVRGNYIRRSFGRTYWWYFLYGNM